ncbi:hypothetical protein C2W62_11460 [Candidatus Entotheonella serta]|nr:hypothetical protein C2W62_11460 [Candidatus Entotheonella serta]
MDSAERYPFTAADTALGEAGFRPYMPLTLSYQGHSTSIRGLLDTGAMVNVLPYSIGIELGAVWAQQTTELQLTGNLAQFQARALLLSATIGQFAPVRLVFAWTQADEVPLLLGKVDFFMAFDACFYRSQLAFEIRPKETSS